MQHQGDGVNGWMHDLFELWGVEVWLKWNSDNMHTLSWAVYHEEMRDILICIITCWSYLFSFEKWIHLKKHVG